MSVERAQKSEIHETTDDATSSPANRTDPDRARAAGDVVTRASDAGTLDADRSRDRDSARSPAVTEGGRTVTTGGTSPDDRAASPPSNFERGAALADVRPDADNDPSVSGQIGAGPGASDGYSGGGDGSNHPDAETALRVGDDAITRGDPDRDRQKLFPNAPAPNGSNDAADELRIKNDPDESSFGGPLKIDDPTLAGGDADNAR
jgi:hypothetical protein